MNRLLAWLPWAILLLGFYFVMELYPTLPERWAIHYDLNNQPNGWASKSYQAVFFPLLMGCGVCALLELVGQVARVTNAAIGPAAQGRMNDMNRQCLRVVSSAIAAFLTFLAYRLPTATSPGFILGPVVGLIAVVIAGPLLCFYYGLSDLRHQGELPKGYTYLYYYNADDPRVWVPKISGVGLTLNFAHSVAWLWMLLLLGIPLAGVVAALAAAKH